MCWWDKVPSNLCPLRYGFLHVCFSRLQTSVFTPAYGSVTNVRVNSSMTTEQVLNLLLHKFRVSNKPLATSQVSVQPKNRNNLDLCLLRWRINLKSLSFIWCTSRVVSRNFHCGFVANNDVFLGNFVRVCLWSVVSFACGLVERTRLRDDEYPLVARVLYGPCEKISKILISEADLGEEVTYDVSLALLPSLSTFSHLVNDTWPLFHFWSPQLRHTMIQWNSYRQLG